MKRKWRRAGALIFDSSGRQVATVWGEGITTDQHDAISHLVASAPDAHDRLDRIAQAAREELARIEQHGGCAGFAMRVLAMATEGESNG